MITHLFTVLTYIYTPFYCSFATKNALLSTKTKVRFLNDVCLRQMMWAAPMMTASPNDVWLRHILWQTSHHCDTKWSSIIFAKQMHHIAVGDASFDK